MNTKKLLSAIWLIGVLLISGPVSAQSALSPLPGTIPIFPLPDVVLFPHIDLSLYIFEPRYRAMLADALRGDGIIGMVLLQPGYEANYEGRPPVYAIGCAGLLTDVGELPDGRLQIVLRGLVKFRITGEDDSRPYRLAHVDAIPEYVDEQERGALSAQRRRLEAILLRSDGHPASGPRLFPETSDEDFFNSLAQHMKVDAAERQRLLEQTGGLSRAEALIELLGKLMTTR